MSQNPKKTPAESTNPKDALGRMKPSLSSIPPAALIHEARAMMNGAEKYGPYNWREKTVSARVYIDAIWRHLLAWQDGEENAPDSGIHHLGHLRASAGILLDAQEQGMLVDDRAESGRASEMLGQFTKVGGANREAVLPEKNFHSIRNPELSPQCSNAMSPELRDALDRAWMCTTFIPPPPVVQAFKAPWQVGTTWTNVTGGFRPGDYARWNGSRAGMVRTDGSVEEYDFWDAKQVNKMLQEGRWAPYTPRSVYVAGPMRGLPLFNFPAFDTARNLAVSKGFAPISPADLDRESGFHETSGASAAEGPEITRQFVKRDTEALLSLRAENNDAIALLPGWEKSTGATAELLVARWLGLKVLDARTMEPFNKHEYIAGWSGVSNMAYGLLNYIRSTNK